MVHLTVKTIKGKKFQINVEPTHLVKEVKDVIEATNPEFPAAQLKLIHSGKILKDDSTLQEYNIKEDEFIVCMVTKPKPAAAAPAPAVTPPAPTPAVTEPAAATPAPAPAAVAAAASPNEDHIRQLMDMGFPEDQARAALRAAMGNPDYAVDILMTGIPDNIQTASAASPSPAAAPSPEAMETLDDFRGHPQFNDLKRLVQGDPAMLSNVLQMIGQQSPNLLARIHENQNEFIALMNEPVDETVPPAAAGAPAGGMGSMMGSGAGMNNPAQMAQMLQALTPVQREQMAAAMGVSPQQLTQVSQMIGSLPPDQFQQLMGMVNSGGVPGAGMGGMRGVPPGADAAGRNVIHLTEEEGAAVARLAELGFDRTDAAQAYLACDKNEALAANLLMDGMGVGMQPSFQSQAPTPTPAPTSAAPEPPAATSASPRTGTATVAESASTETSSAEQNATADPSAESAEAQPEGAVDEDEDMYG